MPELTKEGYDCDEADSVSSALKKIETGLIDLVITDIRMPERSGIELLNIVKENYPDTSVTNGHRSGGNWSCSRMRETWG